MRIAHVTVALITAAALAACAMSTVRKLVVVAAVAMTLMVAALTSSASLPTRTARSTTAAASASNARTWWVDSSWISPLTGWVLGEGKAGCPSCVVIRYTDNGGRSWSAVPTPGARLALSATSTYLCGSSGCVTGIVLANREDGYLFGPDLFTTTDGGRTWHRQTGKPTVALAIVAPGVVWRLTYDSTGCCGLTLQQQRTGTTSWVTVRAPFDGSGTGIVPQIVSTDSARVLIAFYGNIAGGVSSHATFLVTPNLGRTWTKRVDPCGWTRTNEVDAYDASATPEGTVVVECLAKGISNQAFVMASHNGGKTFGPRRPIPPLFANMVAVASANTIVAATGEAGGSGPFTYTLERSTNGGLSWRTVVRDPETLTSSTPGESYLGFVSPSVGHWIGYGNRLWTTTDGGAHWTASNV
jgi:photosystem II stability/assembly factor-like uncharacterized protein